MLPRKRKDLTLTKCRSAVSNGSHILAEVDARSAHMRRYRDLILAHESQLGEVSESESRLIRRAAMITLQLELLDAKFANNGGEASALDLTRYQQATNTLRRTLESLGLKRRAKDVTPSLSEYLRDNYPQHDPEPAREPDEQTLVMNVHALASISIDKAISDPSLLGAALGESASWQTWKVVLKAAFGIELNRDEARAFAAVAGSRSPPTRRVRELWCIIGRRGGKSKIAAALAVFFACFTTPKLSIGEIGMVLVLAASRDQAQTVFGYVKGFFDASEILRREIASQTASEITLRNGIIISVHSTSFRTIRGRTLIACIFDEVAFWRDETSSVPDVETYRAVLPALATTNGLLVGISTPYRKLGLLHQKHRDFFGVDSNDVLVVSGGTSVFNPTLSAATIETQRQADPTAASSEWDAEFRTDISTFLDDELIDAAIEHGRPLELPPRPYPAFYRAFTDSAGGTGRDSYSIAIAHREAEHYVIDLVRGTRHGQKFDPQTVTQEYAKLLKQYRVTSVTGDAYASEWVAGAWRDTGVLYVQSDIPKSQIYLECLPLFTRGLVCLPDHARLLKELRLLERQTHRGGKDSVDHPRGQHDDYANSCCGVLRTLSNYLGFDSTFSWNDGTDDATYSEVTLKRRARIEAIMRGQSDNDATQAHPNISNADLRRFSQPVRLGP